MQIKRIFNEIFNFVTKKSTDCQVGQSPGAASQLNSAVPAIDDSRPNILQPTGELAAEFSGEFPGVADDAEEDLGLLYAYIEAELDNEDAAGLYPHIHSAILTSESAASQYHDLKDILTAERDGTLLMPARIPNFDFSYLESSRKSGPMYSELDSGWRWDDQQDKMQIKFSGGLLDKFRPSPNTSFPVRSHTKSTSGEKMLFSYTIDQTEEKDLMISFVATTTANDPEICSIRVTVDRPSVDGAPLLADSRVYISQPTTAIPDEGSTSPGSINQSPVDQGATDQDITDQQPATAPEDPRLRLNDYRPEGMDRIETISQSTDPFGETIFRHIPVSDLPRLFFAIEPAPLL